MTLVKVGGPVKEHAAGVVCACQDSGGGYGDGQGWRWLDGLPEAETPLLFMGADAVVIWSGGGGRLVAVVVILACVVAMADQVAPLLDEPLDDVAGVAGDIGPGEIDTRGVTGVADNEVGLRELSLPGQLGGRSGNAGVERDDAKLDR